MSRPAPDSPEFERLVAGDDRADLVRIALEIARDARPDLRFEPYLARIDGLAERVRPRITTWATLEDRLRQINWVLYVEEGFSGNDEEYFDPRNSYLDEVLDRRLGIPISLGVLYRAVAERLGLPMSGVNLPGHFVLRTDREDGSAVFVDAFHGGRLLDRDGCRRLLASRGVAGVELTDAQFRPASTAEVVARMLRNLRAIHLGARDPASALPVLRRLARLEPRVPAHRRDLGAVAVALDLPDEGIAQLSAYLEQAPQATDSGAIRALILDARRRQRGGG